MGFELVGQRARLDLGAVELAREDLELDVAVDQQAHRGRSEEHQQHHGGCQARGELHARFSVLELRFCA
jgi:hypothetical protein